MKTYQLSIVSLIIFFTLSSFSTDFARWEFLGKRTVGFSVDRDEIPVTIKEGVFKKIKFEVKKAPVHFRKVVVHYGNGGTEEIELRDRIPAGGQTRAIDLNGNNRVIKKVVFYYNTVPNFRGKATVRLFGMD